MKVTVSASIILEDYLPTTDTDGHNENDERIITLDVPADSGALDVMKAAGIPEDITPLISLNGTIIPLGRQSEQVINEGDHLHFMPSLKGG
ncbi:hypothetical protein [Thioalkalivibrio sp. HK1]|uniref:hypothetical protein n=1 Tax=Thioalkalivibrio sp. HK1 TaxID=1469245 RepID=UPI0004710AD1|nr:hypothetical protein [Thioalkalivibrio sp. HK1]